MRTSRVLALIGCAHIVNLVNLVDTLERERVAKMIALDQPKRVPLALQCEALRPHIHDEPRRGKKGKYKKGWQ